MYADVQKIQAIKYNPASWRVPYDHVVWKDPKQILVIYCLQLLLVLLLYPIPEDGRGSPPKNYYRHYFGRLHRPSDFQFLVDGMTRILNQPVRLAISMFPSSRLLTMPCNRWKSPILTFLEAKGPSNGRLRCSCFSGKPCNATSDLGRSSLIRTAHTTLLSFASFMLQNTEMMLLSKDWSGCAFLFCRR